MPMNPYKLLLTDLDGTLLSADHDTVSEKNRQALLEARKQGLLLCTCTGRAFDMQPQGVFDLGFDYAITSNGAACTALKGRQRVFSVPLSADKARRAWRMLEKLNPMVEWFVDGGILMDRQRHAQWRERVKPPWHRVLLEAGRVRIVDHMEDFFAMGAPGLEKILVMQMNPADTAQVYRALLETGEYEVSGTIATSLEISDCRANKGDALCHLCQHLGISPQQTIAFGDGPNDVQFMRMAGHGVAMGNALEEIKALSDGVALTNDCSGVGDYLLRHVLSN